MVLAFPMFCGKQQSNSKGDVDSDYPYNEYNKQFLIENALWNRVESLEIIPKDKSSIKLCWGSGQLNLFLYPQITRNTWCEGNVITKTGKNVITEIQYFSLKNLLLSYHLNFYQTLLFTPRVIRQQWELDILLLWYTAVYYYWFQMYYINMYIIQLIIFITINTVTTAALSSNWV